MYLTSLRRPSISMRSGRRVEAGAGGRAYVARGPRHCRISLAASSSLPSVFRKRLVSASRSLPLPLSQWMMMRRRRPPPSGCYHSPLSLSLADATFSEASLTRIEPQLPRLRPPKPQIRPQRLDPRSIRSINKSSYEG